MSTIVEDVKGLGCLRKAMICSIGVVVMEGGVVGEGELAVAE